MWLDGIPIKGTNERVYTATWKMFCAIDSSFLIRFLEWYYRNDILPECESLGAGTFQLDIAMPHAVENGDASNPSITFYDNLILR